MARTRTRTPNTIADGAEQQTGDGFILTTGAKARELGVSELTVRRMADAGKLQHIRDCNRNRLFRAAGR